MADTTPASYSKSSSPSKGVLLKRRAPDRQWKKLPAPPVGFAQNIGLSPFQAQLAYNRGIRDLHGLDLFLSADSRVANDPFLLPDMDVAVDRLKRALESHETVGVFGDFDVDGLAGTAILVNALRELGATVVPYIPDRVDDGHGLNAPAITAMRDGGVSLMVTVDCGVGSPDEVALASSLGLETVITDHHSFSDSMPDAAAIVNPRRGDSKYPFDGLTGTGLAFKLAEALFQTLGRPSPDHLTDLAALGTVADVGPLTGENRYLVKRGLEQLNRTQHVGVRALVERSGLKWGAIDAESLSFRLIPRLNAAGRVGDASVSLELLTSDSTDDSKVLAERLEAYNQERRLLSQEALAEAHRQVEAGTDGPPPLIVVQHEGWVPGILGLVAGSMAEHYNRPAVAIKPEGEVSRASARSIPGFDMVAALERSADLFHRFGGHPQAAGFALPTADVPRLAEALIAVAEEKLTGVDLSPTLDVDCEISPALLEPHNLDFIQSLQPFGAGNPAPVFLTRGAWVLDARQVGSDGSHLKMRVGHADRNWDAIAFKQGDRMPRQGAAVDLVYTAEMNDWGGRSTLQLNVLYLRA